LYTVTGDTWELFNSHAGWNHELNCRGMPSSPFPLPIARKSSIRE
jgi:hypothetical protein